MVCGHMLSCFKLPTYQMTGIHIQRREWCLDIWLSKCTTGNSAARPAFTNCWPHISQDNITAKCLKLRIRHFSKLGHVVIICISCSTKLALKNSKEDETDMFTAFENQVAIVCLWQHHWLLWKLWHCRATNKIKDWNLNQTKSFFACWFKLEKEKQKKSITYEQNYL